jgi:hypothetical protein
MCVALRSDADMASRIEHLDEMVIITDKVQPSAPRMREQRSAGAGTWASEAGQANCSDGSFTINISCRYVHEWGTRCAYHQGECRK